MKGFIRVILVLLVVGVQAMAEYRTWTRSDGTTAKLKLVGKTGEGDDMKAKFKMANGTLVEFAVSQLSEADAAAVREWTPGSGWGEESEYDEFLEGNLVKLDGGSFKEYEMRDKPKKYYLFYYTAKWCGPCQAFTPSLVKFYEDQKEKRDDFEIILITSDHSEADMKEYAVSKKMTWPHLKYSKAKTFKKKFNHPGGGIPNLVLTDLEGKVIKSSYEGKNYIGPTAVMEHLGELLKK